MLKTLFILLTCFVMTACQSTKTVVTEVQTNVLVPPKQMYTCDLEVKLSDPQKYSTLPWDSKEDSLVEIITFYVKKTAACEKQLGVMDQWFNEQKNIFEKK